MNKAIKAALFCALLFPGWGQVYLKRYKRGIIIMLPVVAGILSISWAIVQISLQVIKATPLKKGTVDFSTVLDLTNSSIKSLDSLYFSLILIIIVFFWVFSIIDAYLLGKKEINKCADQQSASPEAQ